MPNSLTETMPNSTARPLAPFNLGAPVLDVRYQKQGY
jgi:hypothetical protein